MENVKVLEVNVDDETLPGVIQPSEIGATVRFEYLGKPYEASYQTSTTFDYAYSSRLEVYSTVLDSELTALFADEEEEDVFFKELLLVSEAQKIRDEYVDENYNINDGHYGGLDANSEINEATRKRLG